MFQFRNAIRSTAKNFLASFACAWLTLAPVWADDTEIFFADITTGEISPNILFIVDTSGSMSNTVVGTGKTRMQNVQDALRELLTNLFDVNVGMMRFSNPGGPVLYQVDYIDRNVNEMEDGLIDVVNAIAASEDDAQEVIADGEMVIDDPRLELNTVTLGIAGTITDRVSDSDDDSEEEIWNDRCSENDSSTLEMTHNDGSSQLQAVGVRFQSINEIPVGATISNAFITFTGYQADVGGLAEIRISGEARDTGDFDDRGGSCSNSEKDDITGRTHTTAFADWDLNQTVAAQQLINTPDLKDLVQEMVDHTSWSGDAGVEENDLTFIFERRPGSSANGRYDFYARDGSSSRAPLLTVEYQVGPPPGDYPAKTGLRFQTVNVPKGVTITNASLSFVVAQADAAEATSLMIYGEDNDAPLAYSDTNKISTRTKTSAFVNWSDMPTWDTANQIKTSPAITSIVQEIVSRADWCGGDDMAFILEGAGLRIAHAFDANNGLQPVLNIQYEEDSIIAGSSCQVTTLTKAITSSVDDVEEDGSTVSTTSSRLNVVGSNKIGFRFTGLNLPENADIMSAYLQFVADDFDSGTSNVDIKVQQTGDAELFSSSDGTLDNRTWSSAVGWTISNSWSNNGVYNSPDITTLVKGIVDRGDWSLGNDMAFLVDITSGSDRDIESYDGNPVQAAKLVVSFEDDGTESDIRLVRDELLDVVDSLNTDGYTPIQDTLYEAARYFRGEDINYGAYRGSDDGGPFAYTRVSVAESMVPGTFLINRPVGCTADNLGSSDCADETISGVGGNAQYKTPIDDFCQKSNHIILLTDGEANRDHSADEIQTMLGQSSCLTTFNDGLGLPHTVASGEECVLDLVSFLKSADQSDLTGTQNITTHTIGFNFSSTWLEAVAAYGGGAYKEASSAAELVTEVQSILEQVLEIDSTFVAPVAAINQFNRLNHRSEIYFAVFRPNDTPTWPGNLKKYRLRATDNEILDFDGAGVPAINESTGFFKDDARSAWGNIDDGTEVETSGMFAQAPLYSDRNVYVQYSGALSTDLSASANQLTTSNANLTKAMFGVESMSDTEFAAHLEWIMGKDVDDTYPASLPNGSANGITAENRYFVGDPLHSKPIAITYGGTEADPDITVYFGTNAGFLHAIDSSTGEEEFAFLPQAMFTAQETLRENNNAIEHSYGIDGSITPWIKDENGNGVIDGDDFVRIFFGMRRGGRNYYALDVTDRDSPELMWMIEGGVGDFGELGQTWSQPVLGEININGTLTDVMYFSGGYNEDQDDTTMRATDNMGRAIYIVNAETGALIWSGGNGAGFTESYSDMLYSMPAGVSVADVTPSTPDNMFFIGDLGGQVWRFDIHNGEPVGDLITGGVIADLGVAGGTNSAAINRRFYHSPDIALLSDEGTTKMAVTLGSGYHAHPLSVATSDRFYMIRQDEVFSAPASYTKLTESDLYDATDNDVGEGVTGAQADLEAANGWYFDMPHTGEKVLSTPLTFKNTITFTSYEPSPAAASSNCIPAAGVTRVYQVNLADASPVNDWDEVDGLTEDDRGVLLQSSSIIDEPVIVCTGAGCDLFVGAEKPPVDGSGSDRVVKSFWRVEN